MSDISPKPLVTPHCSDYTRTELLRQGVASAGRGLPTIEPGMPTPAGTGLSRRSFMARSAGLALTVFGARSLAPANYQHGLEAAMAAAGDDRVLVSLYLAGGLDGLSVLAPVNDSRYRALRPNLRIDPSGNALDVFTEDDRLQWHPSAAGIRTLHREGKVSVMPAVGYTNADQSHFTSRHFWEVGETSAQNLVGWMGRYLDRHGSQDNPLQGLSLGYALQPALAPASAPVSCLADPREFSFWVEHTANDAMVDDAIGTLGRMVPSGSSETDFASAGRALGQLGALKSTLAPLQGLPFPFQSTVQYPDANYGPFPARLAMIAELIARGLPLKCVSMQSDGGYDTHNNHRGTLNGWLKVDCDAIYAFQRDLEARGIADRVLIHVWSEFGRRVPENGPDGCDHGAGGVGFIIGTKSKGQMIGEFPGLATLDTFDNLRATSDYRSVYSSILEQWFDTDATPIIPGASSFARVPIVQ